MNDSKERVVAKALELFNEKGIEYAGMREIATALNMRIGNVTYYFPTKDDLVFRISEQYTESNSAIHTANPVSSLYDFLHKNKLIYANMIRYRCLMLSIVHVMLQNPIMADRYEGVHHRRLTGLNNDIRAMIESKSLKALSTDEQKFLISACSLTNRFWISEAALSPEIPFDQQAGHYLNLLTTVFRPYASKKGLKDVERFLSELN